MRQSHWTLFVDWRLGLEGRSADWGYHVAGNGTVAAERSTGQVPPASRHAAREAVRRLLGPGYSVWDVPSSVTDVLITMMMMMMMMMMMTMLLLLLLSLMMIMMTTTRTTEEHDEDA